MTKDTSDIRKQYNRIASIYDSLDTTLERLFYKWWRRQLWEMVTTGRILEIGVGTGKNICFYPPRAQVTAIDISPKMLEKAAARATSKPDIIFELVTMDASRLTFDTALFDVVIGYFIMLTLCVLFLSKFLISKVCYSHNAIYFSVYF